MSEIDTVVIEECPIPIDLLSQSIAVALQIFKDKNFVKDETFENICQEAIPIGESIVQGIINVVESYVKVTEEEFFYEDDIELNYYEEPEPLVKKTKSDKDDDEYIPLKETNWQRVRLERKIQICNLVRAHPTWKQETFKAHGATDVPRSDEIKRWEKYILSGGSQYHKFEAVRKLTYARFIEGRDNLKPVSTRNLEEYALQAASQYKDFNFIASTAWVNRFKNENRISMRKVTRYQKPCERRSLAEVIALITDYQDEFKRCTSTMSPDFILNTDQIGCEYRMGVARTLAKKGSKSVEVYLGDVNKVTHSYTVQYTITASGRLLPTVFLCLQESSDSFGPRIQEEIDRLSCYCSNVSVVASKSGKMSKSLVSTYLQNVVQAYVQENEFVI